ncbi:hypothetical protein EVAR_44968_1 [Eumeta japonica]|uniref:Uncharacterized protein n=1 Tax=Eumeta variegata TaxID=151549 RepID=A0A4C1W4D9_EUMVA|nr:hypothetical protein EVAR_44968_1 [Eumeta japonica]
MGGNNKELSHVGAGVWRRARGGRAARCSRLAHVAICAVQLCATEMRILALSAMDRRRAARQSTLGMLASNF